MSMRITISGETVKVINERLQGAYHRGDTRLVRRISTLLEVLAAHQSVTTVSARWAIGMCQGVCNN